MKNKDSRVRLAASMLTVIFLFGKCLSKWVVVSKSMADMTVTMLTRWVAPPKMFCNWYRV